MKITKLCRWWIYTRELSNMDHEDHQLLWQSRSSIFRVRVLRKNEWMRIIVKISIIRWNTFFEPKTDLRWGYDLKGKSKTRLELLFWWDGLDKNPTSFTLCSAAKSSRSCITLELICVGYCKVFFELSFKLYTGKTTCRATNAGRKHLRISSMMQADKRCTVY